MNWGRGAEASLQVLVLPHPGQTREQRTSVHVKTINCEHQATAQPAIHPLIDIRRKGEFLCFQKCSNERQQDVTLWYVVVIRDHSPIRWKISTDGATTTADRSALIGLRSTTDRKEGT